MWRNSDGPIATAQVLYRHLTMEQKKALTHIFQSVLFLRSEISSLHIQVAWNQEYRERKGPSREVHFSGPFVGSFLEGL